MGNQYFTEQLKKVRRFTGDNFSAARGYDARKPLNFGQRMAILKYARKIDELTARPFVEYKPKRGEKTEAFNYTGQKGWRKFDRAIVYHPAPKHKLTFEIDKRLPPGHRFTVIDKGEPGKPRAPSRYFNVPIKYFLVEGWEQHFDSFEDFVRAVMEQYAPEAELFLIQTADNYLFGSAGGIEQFATKLDQIFNNYGSDKFDPNNKNSSHYRNWLTGVKAFTSRFDILPEIGEGIRRRERNRERLLRPDQVQFIKSQGLWGMKIRRLRNGKYGVFQDGKFLGYVQAEG